MVNNKHQKYLLIGGLFIVAMLLVGTTIGGNLLTGYGGMTAEIVSVDGSTHYSGPAYEFEEKTIIMGTTAQVDPLDPDGIWLAGDPTGVRMEITSRLQPVEGAIQNLGDVEKIIPATTTEPEITTRVSSRIVPMVLGVTVRTYGVGTDFIRDVTFGLRIMENDFNMFESADETIAYLIDIYLINAVQTNAPTMMELSPSSGSVSIPSDQIGTNPVPSWVTSAGFHVDEQRSAVISYLSVIKAAPTVPFLSARQENEATWNIGVDVLVFGHWVVEGELPPIDPIDEPNPIDEIIEGFSSFLGSLGVSVTIIMVIAVIGLILIFIILRMLKGGGRRRGSSGAGSGKTINKLH